MKRQMLQYTNLRKSYLVKVYWEPDFNEQGRLNPNVKTNVLTDVYFGMFFSQDTMASQVTMTDLQIILLEVIAQVCNM